MTPAEAGVWMGGAALRCERSLVWSELLYALLLRWAPAAAELQPGQLCWDHCHRLRVTYCDPDGYRHCLLDYLVEGDTGQELVTSVELLVDDRRHRAVASRLITAMGVTDHLDRDSGEFLNGYLEDLLFLAIHDRVDARECDGEGERSCP